MKKSGLWSACFMAVIPMVVAGPTCVCPIKRLLAPEKCGIKPAATTPAKPVAASPKAKATPAATQPKSKSAATPRARAARLPAPTSLEQAVAQARASHRPIYMEFSAVWCIPCRMYERTVLKTPKGQDALSRVVFFHVDVDKEPALAKEFGITGVPTGLLLRPQGAGANVRVLNRHVGGLSLSELQRFLGQG